MQEVKELVDIIRNICKLALNGELKIKRYYELWPEEANKNAFLNQLHEDIEEAIEHLPGSWLSGKILFDKWYKSNTYLTLYVGFILLDYNKNADDLLLCRKYVLGHKILSEEIIKSKIQEYFNTKNGSR